MVSELLANLDLNIIFLIGNHIQNILFFSIIYKNQLCLVFHIYIFIFHSNYRQVLIFTNFYILIYLLIYLFNFEKEEQIILCQIHLLVLTI